MIKISGIILEGLQTPPKKILKITAHLNHKIESLELKGNKPFNKEKIIEYLKDHYNCTEKDILWPDYIEIPKL